MRSGPFAGQPSMMPEPVRPAVLLRDGDGTPIHPVYADVYHPRSGALGQAELVFLRGNGLPGRWAGRARFVVLETGFGLGNNFLAAWDAWRRDPQRCERLDFLSIEVEPFSAIDLAAVHAGSALAPLARQLVAAWPPLTPDLHLLAFEAGRVRLRLALGDVETWLPQIAARVDAFFLDGFAPARNPRMWSARVFKAIARLAAVDATAATWSAARIVRDGLTAAGFDVRTSPGQGGKRDTTVARFAPRHVPRPLPIEPIAGTTPAERHAIVVGAGLAGCAAARALAAEGWRSTLVERHPSPAREGSGNPAGLWHAVAHAADGPHARFGRAAALAARTLIVAAIERQAVAGNAQGMLQLGSDEASLRALEARLAALGLPDGLVRALGRDEASAIAGIPLRRPALWHALGGWVDPVGLAEALRAEAGDAARFVGGVAVARIAHDSGLWRAIADDGRVIAQAPVIVLANAHDARRLLGGGELPLRRARGQVSWVAADAVSGRPLPRLPISGAGYLLPAIDGRVLFGATSDIDDGEALPRAADHARNAAQLATLSPAWADLEPDRLGGRVGWRAVTPDRLPLIGAVRPANAPPVEQVRRVQRVPGLFVLAGLGSRGITTSALGSAMLAAWISGAPMPVGASLRDAVDPARFAVRHWRRHGEGAGPQACDSPPPPAPDPDC